MNTRVSSTTMTFQEQTQYRVAPQMLLELTCQLSEPCRIGISCCCYLWHPSLMLFLLLATTNAQAARSANCFLLSYNFRTLKTHSKPTRGLNGPYLSSSNGTIGLKDIIVNTRQYHHILLGSFVTRLQRIKRRARWDSEIVRQKHIYYVQYYSIRSFLWGGAKCSGLNQTPNIQLFCWLSMTYATEKLPSFFSMNPIRQFVFRRSFWSITNFNKSVQPTPPSPTMDAMPHCAGYLNAFNNYVDFLSSPRLVSRPLSFPCLLSLRLLSRFWEHWIIGILWICQFASGTNKIMLCLHLGIHHHQCILGSSLSCSNVSRTDTTGVESPKMSWIFPHLNPARSPYCIKDSAILPQEMHLLAQ